MKRRYLGVLLLLPLTWVLHLQLETSLAVTEQWQLLMTRELSSFADFQFFYSSLPRAVIALLVGAALGLAGSLLQQLLQNPLVSPMTLGASSGAWLGLLVMTLVWPAAAAAYGTWGAFAGALASSLLVGLIAGREGLSGLPVVLAGMAVNLLLGALATALILLNDQYARNLFIWGAGNLAQSDWSQVQALATRLLILPLILLLALRPLALMRLGQTAAQARGLNLLPVFALIFLAALWLTASSVMAVGLIGFIGLLTPNLVRLLGCRRAGEELLFSVLLGAWLLLITDALAIFFSQQLPNLVPSGAATALIGAPALIWLVRKRMQMSSGGHYTLPGRELQLPLYRLLLLLGVLLVCVVISLMLAPSEQGWVFAWPQDLVLSLRWPRLVAALAAGGILAVAGVLLQRLIRNPLASPDIMGLSAGATLALVVSVIFLGGSLRDYGPQVAFIGCLLVMFLLLLLGRRHQYAPGILALMGIALAAVLDAVIQFTLARGGDEVRQLLGWLSGSTYRIQGQDALWMLAGGLVIGLLTWVGRRSLVLITIGDAFALARGLNINLARVSLLLLVALSTALVTALMGPVAFVGLLAPHLASLLGARQLHQQLLVGALAGAAILIFSDWLGRVLLYPQQLPAGLIASVLGGSYFIWLLTRRRLT
ncbi:Fe(3+)-hydroxamate ABC transporter permease FhuB [Marinospirillum perlucidum]|uniref:Fe(3+)-hydroxamate ABC transporter permease FhuB n=1 Tax=Marinospirillum perlucidum TaxID=1982602 RepID=UPI000DF17D9D|nr:Fe(3+)-hydroxamate ABC transporter permease FhuB [Marinospirillum perlucidum]